MAGNIKPVKGSGKKGFTSFNDAKKYIEKNVFPDLVHNIAMETASDLKDNIELTIYRSRQPRAYKRTLQFLDAVTVQDAEIYRGRITRASVSIDPNKLRPVPGENGNWPSHMSVVTKEPFRTGLIDVLNDGTWAGLYKREGAHFLEMTQAGLEKRIGDSAAYFINTHTGFSVRIKKQR